MAENERGNHVLCFYKVRGFYVVFTGNSRLFAIFRFCSLFHKQEHV